MTYAVVVIENNLVLPDSTSVYFSTTHVVYSLIFFKKFFFTTFPICSLSGFIKRSIGIVIPRRTNPLIEQMCLNTLSSILLVIMANISNTEKAQTGEDFLARLFCLTQVRELHLSSLARGSRGK